MFLVHVDTDIGIELQEEKHVEDNSSVECAKTTLDAEHDVIEDGVQECLSSTLTEVEHNNDFQESEINFDRVVSNSPDVDGDEKVKSETSLSEKTCQENENKDSSKDGTENPEKETPVRCDCDSNNKLTTKNQQHTTKYKPKSGKISNRGRGKQSGKHLTNRQRKELAKQERKKRREDTKRDPSVNYEEDEHPSVPQDVHVISI